MTKREGRTTAEWVSFAVSGLVLLAVVGLIAAQLIGTRHAAAPIARRAGPVRESAGRFYVPVDVVNEGDQTAADVQITAELTIVGEVASGDQTIDFLAGAESETLTFVFDDDPADGELDVRVTGFATP